MSTLKDKITEELDELADEEFNPTGPKKTLKEATYTAAGRRIENDWVGRIAILISFIGTVFVGMAVSYMNEQKLLTAEGAILIIIGGAFYIGFRMFVMLYNYIHLRLQASAIELDIKESRVKRTEAETEAYKAEQQVTIEQEKLRFLKEQNRIDRKQVQDLQLRVPFFQEAQKNMMNFFARDDIVEALQVPPTFVESIERLDDILLKRTEMNITVDKINQKLNDVMISYADMCQQSKINEELLNQTHVQNAEIMAKWRETDIGLKKLQQQVSSMNISFGTLMEILTAQTHDEDDKPPTDNIAKEVDELLKETQESNETYTSSSNIEYKTNSANSDVPVEEEKKEEKKNDSLPPPP